MTTDFVLMVYYGKKIKKKNFFIYISIKKYFFLNKKKINKIKIEKYFFF